jgi:hypothetical protein
MRDLAASLTVSCKRGGGPKECSSWFWVLRSCWELRWDATPFPFPVRCSEWDPLGKARVSHASDRRPSGKFATGDLQVHCTEWRECLG